MSRLNSRRGAPVISPAGILSAKILVVDDKEDNVRLIEGILRVAGYTNVESTGDPRAVCELYRRNRYSLILLDLQMPEMDGFQVMQGLQEIEGDGYLPVVAITAQPAFKLRALEAGARDFINKPFDMAELRARVRNVLEVRLLQLEGRNYSRALEETVRELEASREILRLKTLEERQRLEAESALAQETQESLLPRSLPCFENFHIRAYNSPTRYVGGDFYDFQQLPSGEFAGVVADVSGKGMPAALLSSMVLGALSMELRGGTPAAESLNRLNRLLFEKSLPHQFVTLFLFLLNAEGKGQFLSAGHNDCWVFREATGKLTRLASRQFFIGMFDFATYEACPLEFGVGDVLVVYSDGLTDAENAQGEMLGEDRVRDAIRRTGRSGGAAVEMALLDAANEFTQGAPQTDDITLVIVERYQ
jgi:serine phosphatase RsbU (regulator of sigma subunit)